MLPYLLQAQFIISSPKTRSVIQRDVANSGQLLIAGKAPRSASTIEARLIPMMLGQGTPSNWIQVATVNSDSTFRGTLAALGGWYRVEIRAKTAATIVADTAVNRVGVGEVFVIAGQSNAQGGIATDVPPATDDRVSCIDLFQYSSIDSQTFPFMFSHVSAGASIGPSNSPYLWGILGDSLTKRLNVPILFLGAAQGGSNSTEWKKGAMATPNTIPYLRISATLLSYINRLGMRAVLWHQGESDGGVAEQTYVDNLTYIINKSRQQLTHSRLAWLVSRASYISGTTNSNVISAQNRLNREVADVYAGPATDGLIGPDNRVDDIHFGGQGLIRVANLWNQSLTDQFFGNSSAFIPAADTIRTDAGWQAVTTGTPFNSLQRVGYRYESVSHNFFLLVGATTPVEGRLERLDSGDFTDTSWTTLTPTATSSYNNPGFSDYTYLRFYSPGGVSPGRYRLSVRPVNNTGPGYQLETVLHDYRNTLFIGNEPIPTLPVIPQANLAITCTNNQTAVQAGSPLTYTLVVANSGPASVTGATVMDNLPATLMGVNWTATSAGGATVTTAGTGNINQPVNLPTGGSVTFIVTGTLSTSATGTLNNIATVVAPVGVFDPNLDNNSVTDSDVIIPLAPTLTQLAASTNVVCAGSLITFTAIVGHVSGSYNFTITNGSSSTPGSSTATLFSQSIITAGSGVQAFTLTISSNGQQATATTSLTVNALPALIVYPSSTTLTHDRPTARLLALGAGSVLWSTGQTSPSISITTGGLYSVTLTNASGCSSTASVSITGSDLTINLDLPQANFSVGAVSSFVANVFEVGGLPTSSGNVTVTITAPVGYALTFPTELTTILVSGGSQTVINNPQWTEVRNLNNRQITLRMNSGAFIGAKGRSSLGFTIARTNANLGSAASITVNVDNDLTMTYDGNLTNNVYTRIISGF